MTAGLLVLQTTFQCVGGDAAGEHERAEPALLPDGDRPLLGDTGSGSWPRTMRASALDEAEPTEPPRSRTEIVTPSPTQLTWPSRSQVDAEC
jgi:hypothetical protein